MKKVLVILLSLVLATMLFGCGETTEEKKDLWKEVEAAAKIRIAFEGAWAPWNYHDASGDLTGFDKAVGDAVAKKLNVSAEFYEVEWSGLFAGLDSGRYDLIINGIERTEEREKKYTFTDPYAYIHTVIITRGADDSIQRFEDLKGKTTCNSLNSTYMTLAERYGATCEGVETLEETIDMLLAGRVDATLNAEVSYFDYKVAHPEADIKVAATYSDASDVCILLRPGDETKELARRINEALRELHEDGTLSKLSMEFFDKDITKK